MNSKPIIYHIHFIGLLTCAWYLRRPSSPPLIPVTTLLRVQSYAHSQRVVRGSDHRSKEGDGVIVPRSRSGHRHDLIPPPSAHHDVFSVRPKYHGRPRDLIVPWARRRSFPRSNRVDRRRRHHAHNGFVFVTPRISDVVCPNGRGNVLFFRGKSTGRIAKHTGCYGGSTGSRPSGSRGYMAPCRGLLQNSCLTHCIGKGLPAKRHTVFSRVGWREASGRSYIRGRRLRRVRVFEALCAKEYMR